MADLEIRVGIIAELNLQPDITGYAYDLGHRAYAEVGEDDPTFALTPVYDLATHNYIECFEDETIALTPVYDMAIIPDPIEFEHEYQIYPEPHYARAITGYSRFHPPWAIEVGTAQDRSNSAYLPFLGDGEELGFDISPKIDGAIKLDNLVTTEIGMGVKGLRRSTMDVLAPSPDSTRLLLIENTNNLIPLHESQLEIADTHLIGLESFGSRMEMYRLDFEAFTDASLKNRVIHKQAHQYNRNALTKERAIGGATIISVSPHSDQQGAMDRLAAQIFLYPEDTSSFRKTIRLWFRVQLSQKGLGEDYTVARGWFDLVV